MLCFIPLLRSTKTFPRGLEQPRQRRKVLCFLDATAFQAKFTCDTSGPASSCDTIKSTWIAPSPPPLRLRLRLSSSAASSNSNPSESWHDFVEACLSEEGAEGTGECTEWASGNNYGTMPNWDTSLVEDMSGYDGGASQGFGDKSTFDGDISKWNTGKVTNMYYMFYDASAFNQDIGSWNTEKVTNMRYMFRVLLRSTKTLGVGTQRK